MATAKFIDDPDFELFISNLSRQRKNIVDRALRAGAAVIADEMRRRLKHVLSPKATGDLLDGFGFTPVKRRSDGTADVHIGFDGYDRNNVPNQLKARVLESGAIYKKRKERKAKPFARPAVNAARVKAYEAMKQSVEYDIKKLIGE